MKEGILENVKNLIVDQLKSEKDIPFVSRLALGIKDLEQYFNTFFLGCISKMHLPEFYYLIRTLRLLGCQTIVLDKPKISEDKFPGSLWLTILCPKESRESLELSVKKVKSFRLEHVKDNIYILISDQITDIMFFASEINKIFESKIREVIKSGL